MSTIEERAPKVAELMRGKSRLLIRGVRSVYRLRNGWIAHRREPRNGWNDAAYWTIYLTHADFEANRVFAGDRNTLERALHTAIRTQEGEFGAIDPNLI